jgi:hypothetical protein
MSEVFGPSDALVKLRPGRRKFLLSLSSLAVAVILISLAVNKWYQPALPIAVTYRPAIDGNSLVAQFHNTSERYLVVQAVFENGGLHQKRTALLNIGPYNTVEFGWMHGWSFMSGETIALVHESYRPVLLRVP